ncbi:MAG: sialidase family protein [Pseudomonadota bacterium]|nr:sialidase family protein [Pseudomonadota bacterium]
MSNRVLMKKLLTHCAVWLLVGVFAGCQKSVVIPLDSPAGANSSTPNFTVDHLGRTILSWQRKEQQDTVLEYSVLSAGVWSEPIEVARGEDWFVNWADFPAVQAVSESFWGAHYLQRTPGGKYAYDIHLRLSNDGGRSWYDAGRPHSDGTLTEHGFVSLYSHDDRLGIVWLDGRAVAEYAGGGGDHAHHGAMTLRSAYVDAQGQLSSEQQIDSRVCDCCQTAAVLTSSGPIIAYRDRTSEEVRDIASSRLLDGDWTAPQPAVVDGWRINGCPVNGPALAARENDVALLWFSGADDRSQVFLSRSSDGGESFGRKLKVNERHALGRVAMAMYPDRSAVLVWLREDASGTAQIVARYVSANNQLGPVRELVDVSAERLSGFPKLTLAGDEVVLAWTDVTGPSPQVRTSIVHIK